MTAPWSSLEIMYQRQLRTSNLTERLSIILSELISKRLVVSALINHPSYLIILSRLPNIHEDLQNLLHKTEASMAQLPKPPSGDPLGDIYQLIGDFTRHLTRHVEGTPDPNGLLQSIRPAQLRFRRAVRETAPEFRPYERRYAAKSRSPITRLLPFEEQDDGDWKSSGLPAADFLTNEEQYYEDQDSGDQACFDEENSICIDEVFDRASKYVPPHRRFQTIRGAHYMIRDRARTRELPDNQPFVIQQAYISSITAQWRDPALNLFEAVHRVLSDHVKQIIVDHFGHFGCGGLQQSVQ